MQRLYYCYDENKNAFFVGDIEGGEISLSAINREEAERIFIDFDSDV